METISDSASAPRGTTPPDRADQHTIAQLRRELAEAKEILEQREMDLAGALAQLRKAQHSEQQLADFFDNAAVGCHWVGPDGIILRANQSELDLLGYTREEYVGRPIADFHVDRDVIDDILARLANNECLHSYEARLRAKDGSLKHVLISSNVLWEDGNFVHSRCFTRDITDRKRAELELKEQIVRCEVAEQTLRENDQRKDEFLATLAHELRNPLAPIRQAALISKAAHATEEQKRWSHDVIGRQVNNMARLLDDLLDISRITRGTLELRVESAELASIIDAAVEIARPFIDAKRHSFTLELPSEPVHFAADPLRLAQVLANLLTNAAKYTDPEGRIHLQATGEDGSLTISVKDTGIGIAANELSNLFDMFSQIKSAEDHSEGGLGIGLALVKGFLKLHGGTVEARSAGVGRGSEFIVTLPLRAPLHLPTKKGSGIAPGGAALKRQVLIADDNRDSAESLATLLRLEGHDVITAHDGESALAAFIESPPHLVLLDIAMPKLTGYQVARKIRQHAKGRTVTLVAVTGWGQNSDRELAIASGFDHHLTKPFRPEELIQLL